MKTFIVRTIIVFVVLGSVMGGFALAEEPPVTEDANSVQEGAQVVKEQAEAAGEVELETARSDMKAARGKMEAAREAVRQAGRRLREAGRRMKESARSQKDAITHHYFDFVETEDDDSPCGHGSDLAGLLANVSNLTNRTQSGRGGRILVIPGGQIKLEELATIMEDMNVMSRIFGKRLLEAHIISGAGYGGRGGYGYGGYGTGRTEGILLDGYGALFLMKVNFSLSPPAETQEEETEEPADRIWDETKREILELGDGKTLLRHRERRIRSKQKYDPEKVEELKRTLIKALKHAANIRNLEPGEWVIITVIGEDVEPGGVGQFRLRRGLERPTFEGDLGDISLSGKSGVSSPAVLTIRVRKSDVDAFAKGEADFDEFREQVQIFTY